MYNIMDGTWYYDEIGFSQMIPISKNLLNLIFLHLVERPNIIGDMHRIYAPA